MMRAILGSFFFLIFIFFCFKDAAAQSPELRYQLGRRLTRFERGWQLADSASRARSTPKMMAAVSSFFSLQLDTAIVKLDEAWLTVQSDPAIETAERIYDAGWYLSVRPLLMDSEATGLNLTLLHQPIVAVLNIPNANCDLSVAVHNSQRTKVRERRWESASNNDSLQWILEPLPPGDYQVTATLHRGNTEIDVIANCFSVVSNLEKRIEPVRSFAVGNRPAANDSKSLSIQAISKMIVAGNDSRVSESDLPFDALLSDLEFLATEKGTVRELIATRPERSIWLQLGNGKSRQHVRLQTAAKPKGAPLIVAFHGAGGSENMFFESCGAGALIEHCRQRGWSVVSPRQSLIGLGMDLGAMLDELQNHLDFDPEKVFLIGHSMGAAQAVSQASKYPSRVRAVAAIGGGGQPTKSKELMEIPFLVAAGEKDFGLSQAKMLHKALLGINVQVDFREVKDVEHMVIVQAILPEAIAFFEMK